MTPSKRLAKEKLRLFEALAAYANMKDSPEDWARFRRMYPDFFPTDDFTEWMYAEAEEWHKLPVDVTMLNLPPLLWFRNRLRRVWTRNDQHGYSLATLLGFEREAKEIAADHPGEIGTEGLTRSALIPGRNLGDALNFGVTNVGLPIGKAVISGVTGQIRWEFGCQLQQAVYELMQERWRMKMCPNCNKYFIAMKTAQKLCSVRCSEDTKRERARVWWNETGNERRNKARTK